MSEDLKARLDAILAEYQATLDGIELQHKQAMRDMIEKFRQRRLAELREQMQKTS